MCPSLCVEGTLYYRSPWQILHGVEGDERSDLWALGVALFILFSGYPPFNGDDKASIDRAVSNSKMKFHLDLRTYETEGSGSLLVCPLECIIQLETLGVKFHRSTTSAADLTVTGLTAQVSRVAVAADFCTVGCLYCTCMHRNAHNPPEKHRGRQTRRRKSRSWTSSQTSQYSLLFLTRPMNGCSFCMHACIRIVRRYT